MRAANQGRKLTRIAAVILLAATAANASERPAPQRRIIVSIPDRVLTLVEDGRVRRIYPTAVGKPGTPTPVGQFTIANRIANPTWYGRKDPVPPGPRNPLGSRWLGLSQPHYGIHGTNAPASIGKAASGGCIRMHKEHVEELFTLVRVGDVVELSDRSFDEILRAYSSPAIPALVETVAD